MQAAPLGVEIGPAVGAMVAQADEIPVRLLQDSQDSFEGDLAIVGELGMGMQDPSKLFPAAEFRHGLTVCPDLLSEACQYESFQQSHRSTTGSVHRRRQSRD